ncbi:Zinc finger, PMZ-type [Sesbania bispinosa]|nr:Zinc finger, PMZ-type [Sesbania bispinosa]
MGNLPVSGMIAEQPMDFVYTPPVLQSRSLDPPPNHQLTVGQQFPDVHSCRRALREAAIALHFEMQTIKSDKVRFTAQCANEGCSWRIHAAKLPGVPTFTIRTIREPHTCGGITHLGHQQASVQWVADSVEKHLRENPNCKPKEILEEIHRVHGITLSYKQAWRGKERIMAAVRGSFEEDYRLLPQYCDQLKRSNPGSIATVYGNPIDGCFQRLFISFQASIYGFLNACRPLIGLDCVPLSSKYIGTLLLAVGFDGDGGLYPLAFGVVDEGIDDNWMWFLSELHNLLETNAENMPRLSILSNRQKSIVDAVEMNFPTAFHGFCIHYLCASFQREFNNPVLTNILWEAAYSLTAIECETKILEIEDMSQEAATWIRRIPPHLWATGYFEGTRLGQLTANVVESLNTLIVEASGLPIIQMMECIRRQLMVLFNERREASMQWSSILVPSAEKQLSEAIEQAHRYQVLRGNEAEFEVFHHSESGRYVVDIRTRCCSCYGWQRCGLPCSHAVAVLLSCRQNVHRFTESYFTVASYRKAYSKTIHPIPDRTMWNMSNGFEYEGGNNTCTAMEVVINPPKCMTSPAPPRKRQSPAAQDKDNNGGRMKRVVHCSRCNQTGHFRTTCSVPI